MANLTRNHFLPERVRDAHAEPYAGTDLVVYTWEERGHFVAAGFQGRAVRPTFFYGFRTEGLRDAYVRGAVDTRRMDLQAKRERAVEKRAWRHSLTVGAILESSWGYDQTNVDFYEVTALRGRTMVALRRVASRVVADHGSAESVEPVPGQYTGTEIVRRVYAGSRGEPCVSIESFAVASLWDGGSVRQTAAGAGH